MNHTAFKEQLERRAQELRALISATEDSRKPVALDQEAVGRLSRMDAMQRQAMAQATKRQYLREIQRIEAALRRIEDGEFGYCVSCGEEIVERRLSIDPTTAVCIICASGADR